MELEKQYKIITNMIKQMQVELPKLINEHKNMYKKFHRNSSFYFQRKYSTYATCFSARGIELFMEDDHSPSIEITNINEIYHLDNYYEIYPEYNEFGFLKDKSVYFIASEEYCSNEVLQYNFLTNEAHFDDFQCNDVRKVECFEDLHEMMFALSLERTGVYDTKLLWNLIKELKVLNDMPCMTNYEFKYNESTEMYNNFMKRFYIPNGY